MRGNSAIGRRGLTTAAAVFLLAGQAFAQEAVDLGKVIPADVLMAGWTNSFTQMKTDMAQTPYAKLLEDPASQELKSYFMKKMEELLREGREDEPEKFKQFMESWKGGVAAFATVTGETTTLDEMTGFFIVEVDEKGKAWIKENMDPLKDATDVKKDTYTVQDVQVYRMKGTVTTPGEPELDYSYLEEEDPAASPTPSPTPIVETESFQYAYVGDYLITTDAADEAPMKAVIAGFKNAAAADATLQSTLSTLPAFQSGKKGDISFYIALDTFLKKALEEAEKPTVEGMPDPMAITRTTGAFDLQKFATRLSGSDEGFFARAYMTMADEKTGLVKALMDGPRTDLSMLKYAPADAMSVNSYALDAGALYDALMQVVDAVSPGGRAMVNMQILSIESQFGVNPIESILNNISGEHLLVQRDIPEEVEQQTSADDVFAPEYSQAYFFSIKNGDQTVTALRTLLENIRKTPNMGENIEVKEEEGITIVTLKEEALMGQPLRPGLAFSNKAIVYTQNAVELQNVIRALSGKLTDTMENDPAVQGALKRVEKEGLLHFGFNSQNSVGESVDQFRAYLSLAQMSFDDELNPEMIPSGDVVEKYFGPSYSVVNVKPGHLVLDWQTLPPGALIKKAE